MNDQNPDENGQKDNFLGVQIQENSPPKDVQGKTKRDYAISEKTLKSYAEVVQQLTAFSEQKRANNGSMSEWYTITPKDLVQDLLEREDLKETTVTTYTYALVWHLRQSSHIEEFAEALDILNSKRREEKIKKKSVQKESSANSWKRKAIPYVDLQLLVEQLTQMSTSGATWAGRAQRWMLAGVATGLRPIEWLSASWKDETKTVLLVDGSKVKSDVPGFLRGRVNEDDYIQKIITREIPVGNKADQLDIETHMETIQTMVNVEGMSFETFRNRCGQAIYRARMAIWGDKKGKGYSLYSARKQFSANIRAEVGPARAAKLMGHSRADTPSASAYGSANQAYSRTGENYRDGKTQVNRMSEGISNESTTPQAGPTEGMQGASGVQE